MIRDSLGDRMKHNYEEAARTRLPGRMPIVVRVDGRAFHTYTRGCDRPFDARLIQAMDETAMHLCREIGDAVFAYVQSDEISLLIHPYRTLDATPWFDGEVQKIVSLTASLAGAFFTLRSDLIFGKPKLAAFDARAFVLPEAEVCNYFVWRQNDWRRNSLSLLARAHFTAKECHGRDRAALLAMLRAKGVEYEELPIAYRRGRCLYRRPEGLAPEDRGPWALDSAPPVFSLVRAFVERWLAVDPEPVKSPRAT